MTRFPRKGSTMDQNNNNFMDSRTLSAILLVGLVWFGWQQYINKKYGDQGVNTKVETQAVSQPGDSVTAANPSGLPVVAPPAPAALEKKTTYSNDVLEAEISSRGMALKNIKLKKFKTRGDSPITFTGASSGLFSTALGGEVVNFEVTQESPGVLVGTGVVGNTRVIKKMAFSGGYSVRIDTVIEANEGLLPSLQMTLEDDAKKVEKGSLFSPPTESQEVIVVTSEKQHEFNLAAEKDGISQIVKQTLLAGLSSHYFSTAFYDNSDLIPEFSVRHQHGDSFIRGVLTYDIAKDRKSFASKGTAFVGPKDISVLESVDPIFLKLIKFGFFSAIAKPLLITMKWINSLIGNWGWSIIILTLLVRMIVMPLHVMSFRSMKAMQKVQPMIQSLREKYKEDPMTLNKEMMDLMKRHKVNPMGGCLPMLLQIPVFFALYRVFSESIELYQSPFVLWIHDLSMKDPYFVLPVLMAAVMYLQQKMTPSTMDPAQAKVMQFMPLLFSFMMISLPSALTLYMFVSTFFGILQQYLFLKDKPSVLAVKQAN